MPEQQSGRADRDGSGRWPACSPVSRAWRPVYLTAALAGPARQPGHRRRRAGHPADARQRSPRTRSSWSATRTSRCWSPACWSSCCCCSRRSGCWRGGRRARGSRGFVVARGGRADRRAVAVRRARPPGSCRSWSGVLTWLGCPRPCSPRTLRPQPFATTTDPQRRFLLAASGVGSGQPRGRRCSAGRSGGHRRAVDAARAGARADRGHRRRRSRPAPRSGCSGIAAVADAGSRLLPDRHRRSARRRSRRRTGRCASTGWSTTRSR